MAIECVLFLSAILYESWRIGQPIIHKREMKKYENRVSKKSN
nr:MAG TPA: hypothetical protein [Caudoviricetes sp.]